MLDQDLTRAGGAASDILFHMHREARKGWNIPCPEGEVPCSRGIFQGRHYEVGTFRCSATHPRWRRENHIIGWGSVLFPRLPVRIQPHRGDGGVVDPGRAIFVEEGGSYSRECLDPAGDVSEWFGISGELLAQFVPGYDPADVTGGRVPRRFSVTASEYALQRRAFRHALIAAEPDELLIEEAICGVLEGIRRTRRDSRSTRRKALVDRLQELLAARYREALGLTELAGELGVSAPHLCRVFREETSTTIHDHREKLRFAAALDAFERGERDLTRLALDLGYSSHAHFTANFTRSLGQAPSRLRTAIHEGVLA
jgi:AraC-like DNA-binding protein